MPLLFLQTYDIRTVGLHYNKTKLFFEKILKCFLNEFMKNSRFNLQNKDYF